MKKKIIGIITVFFILSFSGSAFASDFQFEFKVLTFNPSEQMQKDIYGSGVVFGAEIGWEVWKSLVVWFGGSYYSRTGELTLTEEETKLTIIPLEVGATYYLTVTGGLDLYAGTGLSFNIFTEENPIGKASKNGLGYVLRTGLLLELSRGLFLDGILNYSYCKMRPANVDVNIGGLAVGIGLGFRF